MPDRAPSDEPPNARSMAESIWLAAHRVARDPRTTPETERPSATGNGERPTGEADVPAPVEPSPATPPYGPAPAGPGPPDTLGAPNRYDEPRGRADHPTDDTGGPDAPDTAGEALVTPAPPGGPARGGDVVDLLAPPSPRYPVGDLRLERALRPFQHHVNAPDAHDLNEYATADFVAETGIWLPICKPRRVRAYDLVLLIDQSQSMQVHAERERSFRELLENRSPFAHVRTYRFDGDLATVPPHLRALPAQTSPGDVVIVVTDGIGDGWRGGPLRRWVAGLAASHTVGVANLLPAALWRRTWLIARPRQLSHDGATTTGSPTANGAYTRDHRPSAGAEREALWAELWASLGEDSPWSGLPEPEEEPGVAVPMFQLRPDELRRWASFAVAREVAHYAGPVAVLSSDGREAGEGEGLRSADLAYLADVNAEKRVRAFRCDASPLAFQLAVLLAAVPFELSVVRCVQRALLPESDATHLAEVYCGGLLRRTHGGEDALGAVVDFHPGVREELLTWGQRSTIFRALLAFARSFQNRVPWLVTLEALLLRPERTWLAEVIPDNAEQTARTVAVTLRSLSGMYLKSAQRLIAVVESSDDADQDADEKSARRFAQRPDAPVRSAASSAPSESLPAARGDAVGAGRTGGESAELPATSPETTTSDTDEGIVPKTAEGYTESSPKSVSLGAGMAAVRSIPPVSSGERGPDDPPLIWGNVPQKNHNFTGREQLLKDLHDRLSQGSTTVLPEALHGLGGVGKTQLALEYVYRHQGDYDLIWWVPAETSGQVLNALTQLAHQLQLPVGSEANTAVPAVIEALRLGRPYRNWLLVFDNAEEPERVRQYFPSNGPGKILVTSRNAEWANITGALEVDVFDREESKALLLLRRPDLADTDADRVAETLGDLPLAIEQAAVWLLQTGMQAQEYLELFREKAAELMAEPPPSDYPLPVAAAWNVSLERLNESNPAALHLLQVCAFMAAAPISRKLFTTARNVDASPELADTLHDPIKVGRALRQINQLALARLNHQDNSIQMHRLVQQALINQLSRQEASACRHTAHMLLANADPGEPQAPEDWPRYITLLPHVMNARVHECDEGWARSLVINLVQFLYTWGDHQESRNLGRIAYEHWRETLGPDHPHSTQMGRLLAFPLAALGNFEEAYEITNSIYRLLLESRGPEDEEVFSTAPLLAGLLRRRGDFQAALELSQSSLDTCRRVLGPDDPMTLDVAHNLGVSWRVKGDFAAAVELDQDTHRRRIEVLGADHPLTFNTQMAWAVDLMEAGDYLVARNALEQMTTRMRATLGASSPSSIWGLLHSSTAFRRSGHYAAALDRSGEAMRRFRDRYGDTHPNTVTSMMVHALDVWRTGDLTTAVSLMTAAAPRFGALYGEEHPNAAIGYVNLALLLRHVGRVVEAQELDERALALLSSTMGEVHPNALCAAINLANDLVALGESTAALELDETAAERAARTLPAEHPLRLAADRNLALSRGAENGGRGSTAELDEIIRRYAQTFGPEHPATLHISAHERADCDIYPVPL